ncbi:MAG: YicC/YloC family endoribonuclease [Eubacteriales bacterium]|nr:YicC/YloC family endoribonuclease [Eubacteriales bacterium]
MVKSMTGYGRGEYTDGKKSITVEIKAVNHRYCDVYVKMPRRYSFAEERIKGDVRDALKRGKIEVLVTVDNFGESENDIRLNEDVAEKYYRALKSLEEKFGFTGEKGITLEMLAGMPDVIKAVPAKEDEEELMHALLVPTEIALQNIINMRATEGERLAKDILMRADLIEEIKDKIKARAPEISKEYADKFRERVNEILDGKLEIPEERVMVEAAVFADKANITEELVRLESHIQQLRDFFDSEEETVGKKMDFLIQEMNREANTIGSKSNDTEITGWMLDLKAEIEKIREQVQNIE